MSKERTIQKALPTEVQLVLTMCDHSRSIMRAHGNTVQWTNGYPDAKAIEKDIEGGHAHMILEDGEPIGYFALVHGIDPTYRTIYDGLWIDDTTPYATIHRLCCLPGHKGIGRTCFEWCKTQAPCLKADTHEANTIMQHILLQQGFCYCGTIYIADGTPRRAYQLMTYPMVNTKLREYVEAEILPQYQYFDAAHQLDHAQKVMAQSMELASHYPELDPDMVYTIAAYHDLGLCQGRETHHLASGRIIRGDNRLSQWFSPQQVETMAQAAEDHRASADHAPRSLYGMIVAEADRDIQPLTILRRTVQYGLSHYPTLDREGHWLRTLEHLNEKYAPGGYLKLYIPYSRNAQQMNLLHQLIADRKQLRIKYDEIFDQESVLINRN